MRTWFLHDDLVPQAILDHASPRAEIVNVGKRCGLKNITQEEINALMIEHARAGRSVVRLKSGDPLIFGRAAEEMAALNDGWRGLRNSPWNHRRLRAAAAIQCSLTDRNSASNVIFSTGHHAQSHNQSPLPEIEDATRVVYMPGRDLTLLAAQWLDEGFAAGLPLRRRLPRRAARPGSAMYDSRRPRRSRTRARAQPAHRRLGRSRDHRGCSMRHTTAFKSQHKLQIQFRRTIMPEPNGAPARRAISLDIYAVALSLILALLVRFNLIPPVKW